MCECVSVCACACVCVRVCVCVCMCLCVHVCVCSFGCVGYAQLFASAGSLATSPAACSHEVCLMLILLLCLDVLILLRCAHHSAVPRCAHPSAVWTLVQYADARSEARDWCRVRNRAFQQASVALVLGAGCTGPSSLQMSVTCAWRWKGAPVSRQVWLAVAGRGRNRALQHASVTCA